MPSRNRRRSREVGGRLSNPRSRLRLAQCLLLCALALSSAHAARAAGDAQADQIIGRWLTEPRDGIIEITRGAQGTYQGQIIGGNAPRRVDEHNPDPARRQMLLKGQVILKDMHADGEGGLVGGTIYDPDSGRTYRCHIEPLGADRLKVRGFIGISLLGRSQVWTRFTGASLDLSPGGH